MISWIPRIFMGSCYRLQNTQYMLKNSLPPNTSKTMKFIIPALIALTFELIMLFLNPLIKISNVLNV